jgi:F-type H+-transporting ATPase subunit b
MEILSQAQILLANQGEFGINTDLFDTNIINQIILIPIVLYAYSAVGIDTTLEGRRNAIITRVEDAEKRLVQATDRLRETKKQLSQAYLIFEEIQKETKITKIDLLNTDYTETKTELVRRFTIATKTLKNRERLILLEIKENIAFLVLKQVVANLKLNKQLDPENSIINTYMQESIKMLSKAN